MVEYVNQFVKEPIELSIDERTAVSTAYKNIVGNKRAGKNKYIGLLVGLDIKE